MEIELLSEVHVGISVISFGKEGEGVTFPDETHSEPENAETVSDFVSSADGPDEAGYD